MKIILLSFSLFFIVSSLHAAPILIFSETKTEFIEREFIKDCEYTDTFKETTILTLEDQTKSKYTDEDLLRFSEHWNRPKVWYPGFPNPCFLNKDGTPTINPPDYCTPQEFRYERQFFPGMYEYVSEGEFYRYTETSERFFIKNFDNCTDHDCDDKPPVAIPEPETWSLVLIGGFFIAITRIAKKIIKFNQSIRKIF